MNEPSPEDRLSETMVTFRCACGNNVVVSEDQNGVCEQCGKEISSKILDADLAATITLSGASWDQVNTIDDRSGRRRDDSLVGKSLGHFEIIEPLGGGGMGQVYRALDQSLQRYVAVKVLGSRTSSKSKHGQLVERLLLEAINQARVNHPSVATIYYVGRHEGEPFLAMELVGGGTLANRLEKGPMSYPEAISISLRIAEALRASHQLDLVHGDIKPSNLLLDKAEVVKLSDFGMARKASGVDDGPAAVGGTPNYLAPELFDGPNQSIQSDMYALGVTLFEMVFGKLPIELSGNSITRWAEVQQSAPVEFPEVWPEDVPEQLRSILQKLLAKSPDDRYEDYEQLIAALTLVKPNDSPPARVFPRLVAWGIDMLVLTIFSVSFFSNARVIESIERFFDDHAFIEFLAKLISLIPLFLYTWWISVRRQSFGHGLMQLRVVNRYGLPPPRRAMVGRSMIRLCGMWIYALKLVLGIDELLDDRFDPFDLIVFAIFLADAIVMLVLRNGRSMHDWLFGTRVVLDLVPGRAKRKSTRK